jgi:hypothetical protein
MKMPQRNSFGRRLRTWLLVSCNECGECNRVPTVFQCRTAIEKFTARRGDLLFCGSCDSTNVIIVAAERIPEPMRSWINGDNSMEVNR